MINRVTYNVNKENKEGSELYLVKSFLTRSGAESFIDRQRDKEEATYIIIEEEENIIYVSPIMRLFYWIESTARDRFKNLGFSGVLFYSFLLFVIYLVYRAVLLYKIFKKT